MDLIVKGKCTACAAIRNLYYLKELNLTATGVKENVKCKQPGCAGVMTYHWGGTKAEWAEREKHVRADGAREAELMDGLHSGDGPVVEWMWADAGTAITHELARKNPIRWTAYAFCTPLLRVHAHALKFRGSQLTAHRTQAHSPQHTPGSPDSRRARLTPSARLYTGARPAT